MSNAYMKKLWRSKTDPSPIDIKLAQALVDLEASVNELKADLKSLQFTKCVDVKVSSNKNARVIFVPFIFHKRFQKIQVRLTRELSKKFGGIDVIFIAERVILPRSHVRRKGNQKRPRSRTLTAVHEAILNDITYPTQIVGKRTRISTDGRRVMKVFLDPKEMSICDEKRETFSAVYKKFCNKTVQFSFPQTN
jgi:small subunit ribosomal protein S7e